MNSGLERELTPCVKEWVGPGRGPGRGLCDGKQKQKCVCGQQNGSQGYFLKPVFIKKKGEKPWRQLGRHGISLVKKKENINTCKRKISCSNTFKCKQWMFWGVDYESLLSFLYFLIFVKQT